MAYKAFGSTEPQGGGHGGDTVDGRNPKQPPAIYETLRKMEYSPYQLVPGSGGCLGFLPEQP